MKEIRNWALKGTLLLIILLIVLELSYFLSFLRFKDYNYVNIEALTLENEELRKDNEEIYQFFHMEQPSFIITRVGVRNIHHFYEEILLENRDFDVKIGDPVFTPFGLVGIVSDVGNNITVKLLSSSVSVSVKVGETYGTYHEGKIKMLDKDAIVAVGDKVYTSGLTSIPEGLYVGEVTKLMTDMDHLGIEAEVKLIDTTTINYVGIFTRRE